MQKDKHAPYNNSFLYKAILQLRYYKQTITVMLLVYHHLN